MIDIEWTGTASVDLEAIDDHLMAVDPALANATIDRIEAAGAFLRQTPGAGRIILSGGIRKWTVRNTPYLLLYRIVPNRIEILRVRHDREDWQA